MARATRLSSPVAEVWVLTTTSPFSILANSPTVSPVVAASPAHTEAARSRNTDVASTRGFSLDLRGMRRSLQFGASSLRRTPLCYPVVPRILYNHFRPARTGSPGRRPQREIGRSEEHTSELQSLAYLVCRL